MQLAGVLLALCASALALRPAAAAPGPAVPPAVFEVGVLRQLRQAASQAGLGKHAWRGWQPGDSTHHCLWEHVSCDPEERVVSIAWPGVVGPTSHRLATDPLPSASDFLLPELAGMQRLEVLQLLHRNALMAHMPEAWFQAGSFPRLSKLWIELGILQPPLPDVAPGALPELHTLHITVHTQKQPFVLPSSWGAQPSVLPALRRLHLELPVAPPLPPVWARGFRQLESLNFMQATKVGGSYVNVPLWGQPPWNASKRLPPEWASGFPALISLDLAYQGVTGSVPDAWQRRGAFPALQTLDLGSNRLEGPLPADIFSNLPQLRVLDLGGNALTGSLPAEWASMGSVATVSVSRNWLEGPAFPAAWLAPTALMDVTNLALDANPALTGTLPADLGLLSLVSMDVSSTGMTGSIPEEWCMAPFHKKLSRLGVAGSGISPVLPACAARDMPQLMLVGLVQPGGSRVGYVLAAVLLSLAAAAATAAGVLCWRQRRRKASTARQSGTELALRMQHLPSAHATGEAALLLSNGSSGSAGRGSSGSAGRGSSGSASQDGAAVRRKRRRPPAAATGVARLKALVRELLVEAGDQQQCAMRVLSIEDLPDALAHNLAPLASRSRSGSRGAGVAGVAGSSGGGRGVSRGALGPAEASRSGEQRQWGLHSESLRMDANQLQLVGEGNGSLVQLGEGADGVVFLARMGDLYCAVKVVELQLGMHSEAFWGEVALLHRCTHPRIVPVYGVAIEGQLLLVAMQLMLGGSLREALLDPQRQELLRWENRGKQVAADVAEALVFLHSRNVMHNDLKLGNVLLSEDMRACVADLGMAQMLAGSARTVPGGTNLYAAPEQLMGLRCTLAVDVYGLGLLLVELTTRRLILRRGQFNLPRAPDDCPQAVVELIASCLSLEPKHRPTAAQVAAQLCG